MFLTINGFPVNALAITPKQNRTRGGRRSRSMRGQVRDSQRGIRRSWDVTVKFSDFEEAVAMRRLLEGSGHSWTHEDGFQAGTGLRPHIVKWSNITFRPALDLRPLADRGNGALFCDDTDGIILAYDVQAFDGWTVLFEESSTTTGVIHGVRDDGVAYLSGVRDDNVGAEYTPRTGDLWVSERGGVVSIESIAGAESYVGDVVIVPWRMSHAMLESFTDDLAPRWAPMPHLKFDGDMVADPTGFCVCDVKSSNFLGKAPDSAIDANDIWRQSGQTFSFVLHEIEPQYLYDEVTIIAPSPPTDLVSGSLLTFRVDDLNGNGDQNLGWVNTEQIGAFGGKDWHGLGSGVTAARSPLSRASSIVRYTLDDGFGNIAADFNGSSSLATPTTQTEWGPIAQAGDDFTVQVAFRNTSFNTLRALWANRNTGTSAERGANVLYDSRATSPERGIAEVQLGSTFVAESADDAVPTADFNVLTLTGDFTSEVAELLLNDAQSLDSVSLAGFTTAIEATRLYLGGAVNGNRFIGKIYIWTLYDRVLTPAEITANYEYMLGVFAP